MLSGCDVGEEPRYSERTERRALVDLPGLALKSIEEVEEILGEPTATGVGKTFDTRYYASPAGLDLLSVSYHAGKAEFFSGLSDPDVQGKEEAAAKPGIRLTEFPAEITHEAPALVEVKCPPLRKVNLMRKVGGPFIEFYARAGPDRWAQ